MITTDNPRFFSLLGGSNAPIIEAVVIRLYDEMYRDAIDTVSFDRGFVRNIVFDEFNRHRVVQDDELSSDPMVRASQILSRLEESGWIVFKFDKAQMVESFNFTRHGRRFAQALYESNTKHLNTRLRNVRSTLNSIRAYEQNGDPYDLMDAKHSSEYVVSDLMDRINEINDARKEIVYKAMESTREAGEMYFEFLEKDFVNIAVSLTDDSAAKHNNAIQESINTLLREEAEIERLNAGIIKLFPQFKTSYSPVEEILEGIAARVQSACDAKLPEIYSAISSFTRNSEMVLRQANAIITRSAEGVESLARAIKRSGDKEAALKTFGSSLNLVGARMLDPSKIRTRERRKRTKLHTVIGGEEAFTPEELRRIRIKEAIREAFGYTSRDVEAYIETVMDIYGGEVLGVDLPVENFKGLMMALNASAVALHIDGIELVQNAGRSENRYFSSDNIVIQKKERR